MEGCVLSMSVYVRPNLKSFSVSVPHSFGALGHFSGIAFLIGSFPT